MVRGARYAYIVLAWAFLAGLVVQVFLIGLALFAEPRNIDLHVTLGWILHLVPILMLGVAALARAGRQRILLVGALAVTVFLVPIFALLRDSAPVAAALHPVSALLAFWLAILVARSAMELVRPDADQAMPAT